MNAPRQTSVKVLEPVLIEMYSDGFVQAFGSKNSNVIILNRPHAATVADGRLVEQLLDDILPFPFKAVYFPGMIRATGQLETIKPSDIRRRLNGIDLLHALNFSGNAKRTRSIRQAVLSILGGGR